MAEPATRLHPIHDRASAFGCAGRGMVRWLLSVAMMGLLLMGNAFAQVASPDSLNISAADSTKADSVPAKVVHEKTEVLDPLSLMNGGMLRRRVMFKPEQVMYPDMLERIGGFAMTLGQWGMPYQRYKYGTDAANFDQGYYINPITGAENVYMLDPEHGMPYHDTRTPYLNAYYAQGKADAVQMRVDLSQNIHPLINVSGLYYRRQCKGVYTNHVTDQNTIGLSSNFHTLNERYQVYAHVLMQDHKDQINGGVQAASDGTLFNTSSQPVGLDGANLLRSSRALSVRQFYRILGDSFQTKHTLYVYAGLLKDRTQNFFTDAGLTSAVNTDTFIVYPNLGTSTFLHENMVLSRVKADVGLSYRWHTAKTNYAQRIAFAQEWNSLYKLEQTTPFWRNSILLKGDLVHQGTARQLELKWTYRLTHSQIFRPETYAEVEAAYRIGPQVTDYVYKLPDYTTNPKDSVTVTKSHRPFGLVLHTLSYGRNPTLQQAFGTGSYKNLFVGRDSLSNRRINHVSVGLELLGKSRWTGGGEVEGDRIRVSLFGTQDRGIIYYNGDESFQQQRYNLYAGYFGTEVKARVHWKRLIAETEFVAQGFGSNGDSLTGQFGTSQPKFYSKTSIFFDLRDLKIAKSLRFGMDYWYFSSYDVPVYDPSLQVFYQHYNRTAYNQFGYPRADVWVTANIKKVYLFVKFINLLQGLPQAGYFTTAGYPMQVRQLQLGLNWTFFD